MLVIDSIPTRYKLWQTHYRLIFNCCLNRLTIPIQQAVFHIIVTHNERHYRPDLQRFLHACGFCWLYPSSYPWSLWITTFSALCLTATFNCYTICMPASTDILRCHLVSHFVLLSWLTHLAQLPHLVPSLCLLLLLPSFDATSFPFPWCCFLCRSSFLLSFMFFSILRQNSTWILPYYPNTHLWFILSHAN